MNLFHHHYYQPLESNPKIIYCSGCGDMNHEHEWKDVGSITKPSDYEQDKK